MLKHNCCSTQKEHLTGRCLPNCCIHLFWDLTIVICNHQIDVTDLGISEKEPRAVKRMFVD